MKPATVAALAGASVYWLWQQRRRSQGTDGPASSSSKPLLNAEHHPKPLSQLSMDPLALGPQPSSKVPGRSTADLVVWAVLLVLLTVTIALASARQAWDLAGLMLSALLVLAGSKVLGPTSGSGAAEGGHDVADRSTSTAGPAAQPLPMELVNKQLEGVWVKDAAGSDPMDQACSVMRLNGLVRTAIRLIRGLEIGGLSEGRFDMAIFSVISWFKVRESYQLDGSVAHFNRRDLRRGKHAASVRVQADGSLLLSVSWDEPLGGSGTDLFQVQEGGDSLLVTSVIRLQHGSAQYRTLYRRRK